MKNFLKISFAVLALITVILPAFSFAQFNPPSAPTSGFSGLVPCGTVKYETTDKNDPHYGQIKNPCTFKDIFALVNKVVDFILIDLAVPIAAIMFAYAGFLLLTAGGETGKIGKAKTIFTNVALGLIFIAAAWLIINTILSILGYKFGLDGYWLSF